MLFKTLVIPLNIELLGKRKAKGDATLRVCVYNTFLWKIGMMDNARGIFPSF